MGKDRIRMTRDKYIQHGHSTGLDGFMTDLKRPWLSEKGTKMSLVSHAKTVSLNETAVDE